MTRNTLRGRLVNMGLHTKQVNEILGHVDEHVAHMIDVYARPPARQQYRGRLPGDGQRAWSAQDGAS